MAQNDTRAPQKYLTNFDITNSTFVVDDEFNEIFNGALSSQGYQLPIGMDGTGASWHEMHVNNLPVFDIALGFRSSSLADVSSPYGQGFYAKSTGSGLSNSNPSYPAEYITTSSRIYNYFASVLNDHDDFVFSNSTVDALAIISFRNRKLNKGFKLGANQIKHNGVSGSNYYVSDSWAGVNFFTHSFVGPYSLLIEKGLSSYKETDLNSKDAFEDRIVGKVYKNQGIILLDLVKLTLRDAQGNFEIPQSRDWTNWNATWPVSAVVSSSYSWSLDKTKEQLTHLKVVDENSLARRVYFCKGGIDDFTLTTNSTFYMTGSGIPYEKIPIHDPPFTYLTTVGLYSDDNELMAIGKLNKPFKNDQTTEIHITARISY